MDKLKVGIIGVGRGRSFVQSVNACGGEVVAYCDKYVPGLERIRREVPGADKMTFYTDYDEFLKHDMDIVVLANYFNEHGPFAIKAMRAGKHVFSETISNVTMAQGVELVRAVEETGKIYALMENYPYMKSNLAMEKLYKTGKLGKLVYGEGEYIHPMSADTQNGLAPGLLHWRNWTPRTYYTTHALAPVMKMTDCMPVRVSAMASFAPEVAKGTALRTGDAAAILMIQADNGAVLRINGWSMFYPHGNNYRLCCTKGGVMISPTTGKMCVGYADEFRPADAVNSYDEYDYDWPDPEIAKLAENAGHGGSDFWMIHYFMEDVRNGRTPYWNVYRATAMASAAILGWRSVMNGNRAYDIPDFRRQEDGLVWENDRITPYPDADGHGDVDCSSKPYMPADADIANAQAYWEANGCLR